MPATGSDFSVTSDEMVLGFALAEFKLLQVISMRWGEKRREHVT